MDINEQNTLLTKLVRKGIESENLQDLEMKIGEQLSQELETALKGQFTTESAKNDSETLHDKINKAIAVQTLSKTLVKNDDISVEDLERSETQNIIKKLAVNGVKYEDIMPSSESTTNARDKKEILYNSIININKENSHPIETRRKCRALAKELGLDVDNNKYKYSIKSCVQKGYQAEKIIDDGEKLCNKEISKNNNEACDNSVESLEHKAYKRLAMAAYEQNIKGENIRLSNPDFAVEIHDKEASDPIRRHDLGSVRDKMNRRQAVSKQKREELGQISTKSDPEKKVQAGVRK